MTGNKTPNNESELETATIAVLAVAAAEFLKRHPDELQLIHDSIMKVEKEVYLPAELKEIVDVSRKFYFSCFAKGVFDGEMFTEKTQLFNALKHVSVVIQPPASNSTP